MNNFWSFFDDVRGSKNIVGIREIVISLIFLKHVNNECFSNPSSVISISKNSEKDYNFFCPKYQTIK
jgi:hypothetical protein